MSVGCTMVSACKEGGVENRYIRILFTIVWHESGCIQGQPCQFFRPRWCAPNRKEPEFLVPDHLGQSARCHASTSRDFKLGLVVVGAMSPIHSSPPDHPHPNPRLSSHHLHRATPYLTRVKRMP